MICYDPNCEPYDDEPTNNEPFETKDKAYEFALRLAENELKLLDGTDDSNYPAEGVSFGIVENDDNITINYYYLESKYDTTGYTEPVTIYKIEEIFVDDYEFYRGFYILTYFKKIFGKSIRMYKVEQYDVCLYQSSKFSKCIDFCNDFLII